MSRPRNVSGVAGGGFMATLRGMASLNRRDFLRASLAGSLVFAASGCAVEPSARTRREAGRAKNLIFLVSDGMSLGTLTLAERYRRRFEGRGTHWLSLYGRPDLRRALMDTSSANSLVTDSAAASSAWGCGYKVKNGAINITPDGQARTPIVRLAQASGRSTGLVTTARITHATPAGFAAQADSRVEEAAIAEQYLRLGIDVLLGGGASFLRADAKKGQRDLFAAFAGQGYQVARSRAELANLNPKGRLLGVFGDDHLTYALDARNDASLASTLPSLAEMARTALARLSENPQGFLLQIEGARVDHAAHANDLGALIHEQLAFDDAIGEALRFAEGRDDTLVIVTTDHGNSNPGLNGAGGSFDSKGGSYGDTQACFERIANFKHTHSWIIDDLNSGSSGAAVRERVLEATGIALLDDEVGLLLQALKKDPAPREGYRVRNPPLITLGQILANYTSVGWTGTQHTSDLVELATFGPGSEGVQGLIQNNDVFGMMCRALGLPLAEARAA